MSTSDWGRVKEIFGAAIEVAEPERSSFIAKACQGDKLLQAEIEEMLAAHEKDPEFLKTLSIHKEVGGHAPGESSTYPVGPSATFTPGQMVAGRFQILRFIGRGGMGEVYEVRDTDLGGSRVALKTIRPDVASNQNALRRFKSEVQFARLVTHPNVCRMYEWGRHQNESGEINFLTMQMLEGETLAERLERQGRMSTEEALPLVEQMAEALAGAHEAHVVHRDFKPGNVMLVPRKSSSNGQRERAVVTDFGLACISSPLDLLSITGPDLSGHERLSRSGDLVGTIAYMAPEQFTGGEITPATDIYAFGLVLYKMVTGFRPFQTPDAPALITDRRHLVEPVPSPRTYAPDLDSNWEEVILRCLEIDPAQRFADVLEVSAALSGEHRASGAAASAPTVPSRQAGTRRKRSVNIANTPLTVNQDGRTVSRRIDVRPAISAEAPRRLPRTRWLSRKPITAVLVLAGIVSLSAYVLRLPRVQDWTASLWIRVTGGPSAVNAGDTVFLTNVENLTGDPHLDGVTELMRNALNQSAHFNLMQPSRVCEVLRAMTKSCDTNLDPAAAREVAIREGVPRVVFGKLSRLSDDYILNLDIEKPDTEPSHRRRQWTNAFRAASKNDLFDRIRDGSDWVRKTVGEAQREIDADDRPLQDITTDSWEALNLYSRALEVNRQRHTPEAIDLLKQAVRIDPEFAMAYMRLGDLYDSEGDYRHGYPNWQEALGIEGARRLTLREELLVKGIFAIDRADLKSALEVFSAYQGQFPNDYRGFFYRGYPLMMSGHPDEAIETLEEAHRKNRKAYLPLAYLPAFNLLVNRFDDAARWSEQLRALPGGDIARYYDAASFFMRGRPEKALDMFREMHKSDDAYYRTQSYYFEARVLAELGRPGEAMAALEEGINADVSSGSDIYRALKLAALADLRLKIGDRDGCRASAREALELDSSLQQIMVSGSLLARAGFIAEAQHELSSRDLGDYAPISDVVRRRLRGEIFLAEGRHQEALVEFRKLDAIDMPANDRDYLARAYLAVGQREAAWAVYKKIVGVPGQIWQQAEISPPGFYADTVCEYARIGLELSKPDASQAVSQCKQLRAQGERPPS